MIEATGNPAAFDQALDCVARAGHLLVFGVADPQALSSISPYRLNADELTIVGSMAILLSCQSAFDTVARHGARFAPLVTHQFGLDSVRSALDSVRSGEAVKAVITP